MALLTVSQKIGACGSREFCSYIKRISQVSGNFGFCASILHVTRHSALTTAREEIWQRMVIISAEFCGKEVHKIARLFCLSILHQVD